MSYAKLFLKDSDRDFGYFHFVSTPRVGELIGVTVNEKPATFVVEGVVHMPVTGDSFGHGKAVPRVHIIIANFPVPANT